MPPTGSEIRAQFLEFFEQRGHLRIPDASLIPKNDPTLLFINSGMAPLKPYFKGDATPPHPDLCNVQPCIRTTDVDDIGDRHHLTMFEMMGSWSIGHYFKDRAIELAYELLVEGFHFDPERLYATVYGGNPDLGLGPDDESYAAWQRVGIPAERLVVLGEDNFWGPAGDTGPCGPCTEVFWDTGPEYGPAYEPGGEFDSSSRYIEIWNAGVFMQLDKRPDGSFERLPFNSVDTGSGVERMSMVLQGVESVYETDLLAPLSDFVAEHLGDEPRLLAARRRITDHLRAVAFVLSEGVMPSNEGRGYIPRRLIRKCVALATAESVAFPFADAVDIVVASFGDAYPLLIEQRDTIKAGIAEEQADFERVISRGLKYLDELCGEPPFSISGEDAFTLAATYGMPIDLTREVVEERGGVVDVDGYHEQFARHQVISRGRADEAAGSRTAAVALDVDLPETEFVGYDSLRATAPVLALVVDGERGSSASTGAAIEVVTAVTPFYPEGGGQVGDRGVAVGPNGRVEIDDTRKLESGVVVHRGKVVDGAVATGDEITLEVSTEHRLPTMLNHSATHLLHAALRSVLGEHVHQAGSLVEPRYLRFDFTHPSKLTPDEIRAVELAVNDGVRRNVDRETHVIPKDEALERGALAMFDEKYADEVRVVEFPSLSMELCGGTHVDRSGDIGLFRIVSEESIGKGVRRIVAYTGEEAVRYTLDRESTFRNVLTTLGVGADRVGDRIKELLSQPSPAAAPSVDVVAAATAARRELASGAQLAIVQGDLAGKNLRADALRAAKQLDAVVAILSDAGGRATVVVAVPPSLGDRFDAAQLLAAVMPLVAGRGGGAKDVAQGGGGDAKGLANVAAELERLLSAPA